MIKKINDIDNGCQAQMQMSIYLYKIQSVIIIELIIQVFCYLNFLIQKY
jgi:hypothetical protein